MDWKASPPTIEIAVESIAALSLSGAVGFAMIGVAPFGAGPIVAGAVGAGVAAAAWWGMRRIDRRRGAAEPAFALVELPGSSGADDDVLLLDQRVGADDILLLDDPLPAIDDGSRVVRLFAADPADPDLSAAAPAEMIARIERFLDATRGDPAAAAGVRPLNRAPVEDASAALHAALADIRRSLRRA